MSIAVRYDILPQLVIQRALAANKVFIMQHSDRRPIRSFVKREGRITKKQQWSLDKLLPDYGLNALADFNPATAFDQAAPLVLEIGFGMGDSFIEMVASRPDANFVGVEVHRPGIGNVLMALHDQQVSNMRIVEGDAVAWLRDHCAERTFDEVLVLFPDPWHKKRHNKRRIINAEFVTLLADRCKPGARLHLATDWMPYAEVMREVMAGSAGFQSDEARQAQALHAPQRAETKFERRGRRLGHAVCDLFYVRKQD